MNERKYLSFRALLAFVDRHIERRPQGEVSSPLHNLDLFFCQPVKLVDQDVYLMVCSFYPVFKRLVR
jgi:hypothetical protein